MHLGKLLEKSKKVVCCLRTGLQNGVADFVKARESSLGLSAELETMATDSQELSSPEARWPICT